MGELARLDPDRQRRKGVPEVVMASGKSPDVCAELALRMAARQGCALVSRVNPAHDAAIAAAATKEHLEVDVYGSGRRLRRPGWAPADSDARVGLLTAGTADVDVAEEARMLLETMGLGCAAPMTSAWLRSIAWPSRWRRWWPRRRMPTSWSRGWRGALPSVVSGLVPAPIIAVPTSTGYGARGKGIAALLAMLQTCSPGVAVVNIDNGIGAAATAGADRPARGGGAAGAVGGGPGGVTARVGLHISTDRGFPDGGGVGAQPRGRRRCRSSPPNPSSWRARGTDTRAARAFTDELRKGGVSVVVSHANYLINLAGVEEPIYTQVQGGARRRAAARRRIRPRPRHRAHRQPQGRGP